MIFGKKHKFFEFVLSVDNALSITSRNTISFSRFSFELFSSYYNYRTFISLSFFLFCATMISTMVKPSSANCHYYRIQSLISVMMVCLLSGVVTGCQVLNAEGLDVTSDVFVEDFANTGHMMVNCTGPMRCKEFQIVGCSQITCSGTEACERTKILQFTHKVLCDGLHGCHQTEIGVEGQDDENNPMTRYVECQGIYSCEKAIITEVSKSDKDDFKVLCSGEKACRKTTISISHGSVTCSNGSSRFEACRGFVGISAPCLYCDNRGCSPYINECRYTDGTNEGKYRSCMADKENGTCQPRSSGGADEEPISV